MMEQGDTAPAAPQLPLGMGLALWFGIVLVIAGFVAIGTLLGIVPLYAGFLFVWYWATVDKMDAKVLPATVIGACAGAATAGLAPYAAANWGAAGGLAVLALILVALLVHIMNWLPTVFNPAFMLFLTVASAPLIAAGENFQQMLLAIVVGAAYFGAVVLGGTRLMGMMRKSPAVAVPEV